MLIAILRHAVLRRPLRHAVVSDNFGPVLRRQYPLVQSSRWLQSQGYPGNIVPLRKQLKDEAKAKKSDRNGDSVVDAGDLYGTAVSQEWELTVGLEIHAQLNTERKLFSDAFKSTNDQSNTQVAPFDFALPGSQPAFQKETLLPAIRAALALNCHIQQRSQFDRKHYFYADQPAGYQITQYYQPFATDGFIVLYDHDGIAPEDGATVQVGIKQVQLEQDTAKTILQPPSEALLDFNRVSHPLIEIITLPQIHQPKTAAACVKKIQTLLQAVNAVTTGMESGGLRADVNVSVRRTDLRPHSSAGSSERGQVSLGQRTEIKNLSSIKAIEDAIIAERNRQISVLESGGVIEGETRGWTLGASETIKLRGKEGEVDYRYMPDPDLQPLFINEDLTFMVTKTMPQLPDRTVEELVQAHGLTLKDAKTLVELDDGERLDYFDHVCEQLSALHCDPSLSMQISEGERQRSGVNVANWALHEMGGLLSTSETAFSPELVPAQDLAYICLMLEIGKITRRTAKHLFGRKFRGDRRDVKKIIAEENLLLVHLTDEQYATMALDLINSNPVMAERVKKGQLGKLQFFIGQMMRKGQGKVMAPKAEAALRQLLEIPQQ